MNGEKRHILVLGGNGYIGSAIIAELLAGGFRITGIARRPEEARRLNPAVNWLAGNLNIDHAPEDWLPRLAGIDAIVNAAGVLQDGGGDDLRAAHIDGPAALMAAAERAGIRRFVQISAAGAEPDAATAFLATKGEGDARLMESGLDWVVLRPGLVLGRATYGGTALLRALAALPGFIPVIGNAGPVQVVSVGDVARAVRFFLEPDAPARLRLDLVGAERHAVGDILARLRDWLGFPPARRIILPDWLAVLGCRICDAVSHLGWRPPLRTTMLDMLRAGVSGDAAVWPRLSGMAPTPLAALPHERPAGVQDRWHARLFLLRGLAIAALALFWLASGAIALLQFDTASRIAAAGLPVGMATAFVAMTALLDLAIGLMLARKRFHRAGLILAIATSLAYLIGGTLFLPWLWADPLGPLVKIVPQLFLALLLLAIADER